MTRACQRWAVVGLLGMTAGWGAAPAAAETVYHWRTEDGTYAFTDDEKAIPERYRDQVQTRQLGGGLDDYERYTPATGSSKPEVAPAPAPTATPPVSAGPDDARLKYLRALNAETHTAPAGATAPKISVRPGGDEGPVIDVTPTAGDEPVVIETIRSRPKGSSVTRSNVVVRQGDRVLTVIKPQLNETNVSEIADEEDFE